MWVGGDGAGVAGRRFPQVMWAVAWGGGEAVFPPSVPGGPSWVPRALARVDGGGQLSKKRTAAAIVAGAAAVLVAAPPAGAGDGFTVTPTSGPAGTVISVSGTGCYEEGLPDRHVSIILSDGEQASASSSVVPDDNGAWSGQLTVPAGADPAGTYQVYASCWGSILGDNGQEILAYGPVAFDVTGGGPAPTTPTTQPNEPTPTTQPPTEPTVPGEPETPGPPPATPVVDEPDFTG
jgi:hypothetical protein